jgi:hypothetical protein
MNYRNVKCKFQETVPDPEQLIIQYGATKLVVQPIPNTSDKVEHGAVRWVFPTVQLPTIVTTHTGELGVTFSQPVSETTKNNYVAWTVSLSVLTTMATVQPVLWNKFVTVCTTM